MIFCHDKREYMTLGEYMEKYPIAYAEAVESMTAEQKALFAARFEDRYIYLPKDETSDTGENFTISANVTFVTQNADNPESISAGGTAYWKYMIDSDAEDPVIAVTGCEWIAPADGIIFLFNPTGNITITVTASLKYYNVTLTGENCSFSPSSVRIQARGSVRVNVIPATNYKWNGALSATGAAAIKNVSGNYFDLMGATGDVTVSVTCDRIVYPLTVSGINCTPNPKPTQIAAGGTLAITYTAAAGYDLPETSGVGVTGCSFGWNQSTGVLTLYNPTGAVSAGVVAVAKSYAITATVTNGTATGANVIHTWETVALTIAADSGYNLPDTITVTGASQTWNKETGTLTLSNPTGDVTVSVTCDQIVYPLMVSGINCTPNPKPTQIAVRGTLAITYTAAAGYDLPETSGVGVTGCSFDWNQSTGVLTLYNPTRAVSAGVVAVAKSYAITATVTNGTATGANVIHTGETVALTIAADSGYNLPDTITVTGASQTWNKETGTLTLSNPTGAVTVSAVCVAAGYTLEAGTYNWINVLGGGSPSVTFSEEISFSSNNAQFNKIELSFYGDGSVKRLYYYENNGAVRTAYTEEIWSYTSYKIIALSTAQTVSADFYNWAITGGNLVKQTGETWVLNSSISGGSENFRNLSFVCDSLQYDSIYVTTDEGSVSDVSYGNSSPYRYLSAYNGDSGWYKQVYRTLTFSTPPTGNLLTWLQSNGTKQ